MPKLLSNTLRLERLDQKRGRKTIVGPVGRYNELVRDDRPPIEIEPELINAILKAVEDGAITLETAAQGRVDDNKEKGTDDDNRPIEAAYLQLVMTRLWEEEAAAGSRVLKLDTFHALGGAQKIVSSHLDTVMDAFPADQRDLAADLFRHLVTPTGSKIALSLEDLAGYKSLPPAQVEPLLNELGSQRVRILRKVPGPLDDQAGSRYEIFHDVLATVIVAWQRRYATGQATLEEARKAEAKRLADEQAMLEEARKAEAKRKALAAEADARRRDLEAAADARRKRILIRSAIGVSGLTTLLLLFALQKWQEAVVQTKIAREQEQKAEEAKRLVEDERKQAKNDAQLSQSSVLAARAASFLNDDPDLSLALAFEAIDRARTATADGALRQALVPTRPRAVLLSDDRSRVLSIAYSPDGARIATARVDGKAEIWDAATGELERTFDTKLVGGRNLKSADFSGGGRYLVALDDGGSVAVYDLNSSRESYEKKVNPRAETNLIAWSFSRTRSKLVVATADKAISVWDLPSLERVSQKINATQTVTSVACNPDGDTIAVGLERPVPPEPSRAAPAASRATAVDGSGPRDTQTAEPRTLAFFKISDADSETITTPREVSPVRSLVFSPDGVRLAVVNGTDPFMLVKVWREQSGIWVSGTVLQPRAVVTAVAFNAQGTLLAAGSREGSVQVWDAATGVNKGAQNFRMPVSQVVFSPEGERLLVRTGDRNAILWVIGTAMPVTLRGHTGDILDVAFGADGQTVATASADGTARVWDVVAKPQKSITIPGGPVASRTNALFTRDSKYVIVAGVDNHIRIVAAATGELAGELSGNVGPIAAMALSFDGTKLAVASAGNFAQVWDMSSRKVWKEFPGHSKAAFRRRVQSG